jgi:hypothetical protein
LKRNDANETLSPMTRVNEACLKLASGPEFASQSRLHFKRIVPQAMRQILIDAAWRRSARPSLPSPAESARFDCGCARPWAASAERARRFLLSNEIPKRFQQHVLLGSAEIDFELLKRNEDRMAFRE